SKTVRQIIPVNFRSIGAAGVLIAVLTGAVPALMGEPFLTHRTDHARLPLVGDVHPATAVLFDIGVFLAVLGTAMTIISDISENERAMETLIIVIAGILFSVGTHMLLSKNLLRIIFGTGLYTHASHLMLMAVAGLKQGAAPLLSENASAYVDPVPQALILTSIVIN